MRTIYLLIPQVSEFRDGEPVAAFSNEEDAKKAGKGIGFWGSDARAVPMRVYDGIAEYEAETGKTVKCDKR